MKPIPAISNFHLSFKRFQGNSKLFAAESRPNLRGNLYFKNLLPQLLNVSQSLACSEVLVCVQALGCLSTGNLLYNFAGGDRTGHVTQQAVLDTYKRYSIIHIIQQVIVSMLPASPVTCMPAVLTEADIVLLMRACVCAHLSAQNLITSD